MFQVYGDNILNNFCECAHQSLKDLYMCKIICKYTMCLKPWMWMAFYQWVKELHKERTLTLAHVTRVFCGKCFSSCTYVHYLLFLKLKCFFSLKQSITMLNHDENTSYHIMQFHTVPYCNIQCHHTISYHTLKYCTVPYCAIQ